MAVLKNFYNQTFRKMDTFYLISRYAVLIIIAVLTEQNNPSAYNFKEWSALVVLGLCYPIAAYPFRHIFTMQKVLGMGSTNYVIFVTGAEFLIFLIIKLMITFFIFMWSPLIAPITLIGMYLK
ncbi:hypothetical protein [uncultured Limosilactobacillus sp.]|uniref:hypothetical protein n=1 Tax=uncultured Limosilactobacillus sp. TaxID=2837629 RepID=UPI0025EC5567|nr:hypothetical protein [uncultured Limosilactobacillus sp.]